MIKNGTLVTLPISGDTNNFQCQPNFQTQLSVPQKIFSATKKYSVPQKFFLKLVDFGTKSMRFGTKSRRFGTKRLRYLALKG